MNHIKALTDIIDQIATATTTTTTTTTTTKTTTTTTTTTSPSIYFERAQKYASKTDPN